MMATLQPLLDAYSANTDFLTGSYTADHTGLDGMLDVVEVEINTATGAVTINDRIADTQIAAMTTTAVGAPTDPISTTEATASVTAVTDIQAIASSLSGFATALNKGSNLLAADLDPYVASDANFGIHDGTNRTQFINDILEGASGGADMPISSISGVSIIKTEGSVYTISAVFHWSDGRTDTNQFTFTNEGGLWKIKGNGYKADVDVQFSAEKYVYSDGSVSILSGIRVDVEDNWNQGLQSAVITGPGLPSQGYSMAKRTSDAVDMEPYGWTDNPHYHIWPISDATIDTMSATDLTYTVVVKDSQGATVETQTVTLPQRPYKESELTSGHFIQVSGISNLNTSSLNMGGTLSFTYAKPTAYQVAMLGVEVGYSNTTGLWDATDKELYLTGTSGSIVTLAPQGDVTGGWLRLDADDIYGRNVVVEYHFSPTSNTAFPGSESTTGGGTTTSPLIGTSYDSAWGNVRNVNTMLADGTYVHLTFRDPSTPSDCVGGTGMELGTYTATSNTFTITSLSIDTDGCDGATDIIGTPLSYAISGNQIYTNGIASTLVVADPTNLLVGSWYAADTVLTFFSDGTYTFAQNGPHPSNTSSGCDSTAGPDAEMGTYTSTASNITITGITFDVNCRGFSVQPAVYPYDVPYAISGNQLTLDGAYTLTRVQ